MATQPAPSSVYNLTSLVTEPLSLSRLHPRQNPAQTSLCRGLETCPQPWNSGQGGARATAKGKAFIEEYQVALKNFKAAGACPTRASGPGPEGGRASSRGHPTPHSRGEGFIVYAGWSPGSTVPFPARRGVAAREGGDGLAPRSSAKGCLTSGLGWSPMQGGPLDWWVHQRVGWWSAAAPQT